MPSRLKEIRFTNRRKGVFFPTPPLQSSNETPLMCLIDQDSNVMWPISWQRQCLTEQPVCVRGDRRKTNHCCHLAVARLNRNHFGKDLAFFVGESVVEDADPQILPLIDFPLQNHFCGDRSLAAQGFILRVCAVLWPKSGFF